MSKVQFASEIFAGVDMAAGGDRTVLHTSKVTDRLRGLEQLRADLACCNKSCAVARGVLHYEWVDANARPADLVLLACLDWRPPLSWDTARGRTVDARRDALYRRVRSDPEWADALVAVYRLIGVDAALKYVGLA